MNIKFISDIGSNHNQSLIRAKKLILAAKKLGCWGVKFQLYELKKLYKNVEKFKGIERSELNKKWIPKLKEYCDEIDIKFGCSVFDLEGVSVLKEYVDFYKISSFDILRKNLFAECISTEKPLMFSTGLASNSEIADCLNIHREMLHYSDITILHCISKYPAVLEESCMNRIETFKRIFGDYCNIGYSVHVVNKYAMLAAIVNGAETIEFHLDLNDKKGWEYNHGHCWTVNKFLTFREELDQIQKACEKPFELTREMKRERTKPRDGLRHW